MKKFNLVLLVLVAALIGSSFVACSDVSSNESSDVSSNESSFVNFPDKFGKIITFIPVPGCNDPAAVEAKIGHTVGTSSENFKFEAYFEDSRVDDVKEKIRTNDLYHDNDYILVKFTNDNPDELYKLNIDGTVVLLEGTRPVVAES